MWRRRCAVIARAISGCRCKMFQRGTNAQSPPRSADAGSGSASSAREAGPCSAARAPTPTTRARCRTISTACGSSIPGRPGPRGRLAFLRWQLADRGASWPAAFPSPFAADRPPAQVDGDAVRVTYVGHASFLLQTRGQQHPDRSGVGRSRQPVLVRRTQARESAGHRLRRPAEDRRGAGHAQPLRPHGRRHHRPAVAALPPAHRHAARQRHDPEGARAGSCRRRRRLGRGGRSRRRPRRARRADAALVGARHRRSQPRAVGELRRAGGRARKSTASATAASAPAPPSSACASAIPVSRWRCCRSAPTSRAGSCAHPT